MGDGMAKTVLIADESVTIRSVAESLLRGESFSVHSAADGQMAIELASAEKPDLALIGEKLPGRTGAEVCQALKSDPSLQGMPIIFMRTDHPGSAPAEADAILTKPFSPQSLLDWVHRFLGAGDREEAQVPTNHAEPVAVPEPASPVDPQGLEEELIDKALGLDEVGSQPAEEREVAGSSGSIPFDEEMGTPIGLAGDEKMASMDTGITEEVIRDEDEPAADVTLDSPGMPDSKPAPPREDDELERALDMALGGGAGDMKADDAIPSSTLKEVNLGDALPEVERPQASEASSASPGQELDLGGPDAPEEDRPHDYDWFLKEMARETDASKQAPPPAPEPPRIEPLETQPEASPAAVEPQVPGDLELNTVQEIAEAQSGYDEFISEFRKEIARLEGTVPPAEEDAAPPQAEHVKFEEARISGGGSKPGSRPAFDADVKALGDQLIDSVTQNVARELAAKIDSKVIYELIEQKLREQKPKPGA
jgi:CheY-like chemotaxis protein